MQAPTSLRIHLSTTQLYRNLARARLAVQQSSSRSYHADSTPVQPLALPRGYHSLLPLVHECNNLILPHHPWHVDLEHKIATRVQSGSFEKEEVVLPFLIVHDEKEQPIGFIRPQVASALENDHQRHLVSGSASPWDLRYSQGQPKMLKSVAFAEWVNEGGKFTRTMHMNRIVAEWKKANMFKEILRNWSDEAYPVYIHPPPQVTPGHDPLAFAIERAALPLFGLVNFGALLIGINRNEASGLNVLTPQFILAYVQDPVSKQTLLSIPRRASHKRINPGKLDVTVGSGMGLGETALGTIIRESVEEALLDPDYVQQNIRPVGVLPFPNRSPGGWILPGMYFLFDLPLPPDGSVNPRVNPLHRHVEKFELVSAEDVLQLLLEGNFKDTSAMAIIDFLLRHGYVTEETDPRYLEVCRLLKTDIKLPVAWRPH